MWKISFTNIFSNVLPLVTYTLNFVLQFAHGGIYVCPPTAHTLAGICPCT